MATLAPVDEATEPFLTGRFAPVHDEISADDLVVDGTLPTDLTGAYLRNGPNPKFPPLGSYTYPLEGRRDDATASGSKPAAPATPTGSSAPTASRPKKPPARRSSAG